MHWDGGRYPQGAQPMPSHCPPDGKCQLQMAFVTDSCRPQPLCQSLPTACLTAPGAASEVPSPSLCPATVPLTASASLKWHL